LSVARSSTPGARRVAAASALLGLAACSQTLSHTRLWPCRLPNASSAFCEFRSAGILLHFQHKKHTHPWGRFRAFLTTEPSIIVWQTTTSRRRSSGLTCRHWCRTVSLSPRGTLSLRFDVFPQSSPCVFTTGIPHSDFGQCAFGGSWIQMLPCGPTRRHFPRLPPRLVTLEGF
jgi:hypothetical protein